MPDDNTPVNRADLAAAEERLRADLRAAEERLKEFLRADVTAAEERLKEFLRDVQTELLRGFERYAKGTDVRLRKLEVDASNQDQATGLRLASIEERLLELERWRLEQR